eukprot:TRINITY_DN66005_c1_g1_i1.p1 TRINITY_DN66005_c1_g1~~TRINITY_DN66005_c1_g1_i1.p1  ORF type:complete len:564 (-),score=302.03 TRINITY_DN66005_c1_g1_i1:930-2411(-)
MQEVASLCEACGENGTVRLLLTSIPYFRDVVIMAFECPHCLHRENRVQPAGGLAPKTVRYELKVDVVKEFHEALGMHTYPNMGHVQEDLNRQVLKSDYATIEIPEVEFHASKSMRGEITTVEGVLTQIVENLKTIQERAAEEGNAEAAAQFQPIIDRIQAMSEGKESFTLILEDISGNSFLQNPNAPLADKHCRVTHRSRTRQETESLGYAVKDEETEDESDKLSSQRKEQGVWGGPKGGLIVPEEEDDEENKSAGQSAASADANSQDAGIRVTDKGIMKKLDTYFDVTERAANFPGECHNCHQSAETRMCVTNIPYFKDIVIFVTDCENCGYKDSEIKPGGAMGSKGRRVTLKVTSVEDLGRDLMKSDSASVSIPELELELGEGTLGGKYTTLEGLMADIRDQLQKNNVFSLGDSATETTKDKMTEFFKRFDKCASIEQEFTIVLDDPLGNVYIHNPHHPKPDPNMTIEHYTRTDEQDEHFGIKDMVTENYY